MRSSDCDDTTWPRGLTTPARIDAARTACSQTQGTSVTGTLASSSTVRDTEPSNQRSSRFFSV